MIECNNKKDLTFTCRWSLVPAGCVAILLTGEGVTALQGVPSLTLVQHLTPHAPVCLRAETMGQLGQLWASDLWIHEQVRLEGVVSFIHRNWYCRISHSYEH